MDSTTQSGNNQNTAAMDTSSGQFPYMTPSDPRTLASHMICELEGTVSHNRAKAYIARSQQAENSTLAAQNYNGSFLVNRRIANENTDALFR